MRKDEYKKKISALFDAWKQKAPSSDGYINHPARVFISDGIVADDPDEWYRQDCRPLFLLKEAYGGDQDWDLTWYVRSVADGKNKNRTWRNVAMWTYGLLNTHADHALPGLPEYHRETDALPPNAANATFNGQLLKKIAVVNIKKSDGEMSSSDDDLLRYAEHDAKELWQEIELINPTVIVSANTKSVQDMIAEKNGLPKIQRNLQDWTSHLKINGHDTILIEYWHPANHFPNMMNFYTLTAVYQHALQMGNNR